MDELRKMLKEEAKSEKKELKELKRTVRQEAREVKKAARAKGKEAVSLHKMEKEIRKEKIGAEIDYKKELIALHKTVKGESKAQKALTNRKAMSVC